jgi:uncharacterized lipoprotein
MSVNLVALVLLVLTACTNKDTISGKNDLLRDSTMDYTWAKTIPRIKVPKGLDQQAIHEDLYKLPALTVNSEVSQRDFEPPRPDFVFAEIGNADVRITGSTADQMISVWSIVPQVWQQLEIFWQDQGFNVISKDAANGIMLTDWYNKNASKQPDGVMTLWLKGLMGRDANIPHHRFRTILTEHEGGRIHIELQYALQTTAEIAADEVVDWNKSDTSFSYESGVLYELLRHLSRSMKVAYRSKLDQQDPRQQVPLLGRDQHGQPLIKISLNMEQAMAQVLQSMDEFDVGSHNVLNGKIYFTHTTNLRGSEYPVDSGGILDWLKDLHTNETDSIKFDTSFLDSKTQETETAPILYSSQGKLTSDSDDLKNKKGFKIWLADEVIYVFEDDDQGDLDAKTGEYTYTGRFQLSLSSTLKGVYLQVLDDQGEPAAINHAEEILWRIQRNLEKLY